MMTEQEKLLSRLDFSQKGLEAARKCLETGQVEKALEEIINHFRNREKPVYLFDESEIAKFNDRDVIEEADEVCDHHILGFDLGQEINWRYNATADTSRDSEWMWSLARHVFWQPLARAYALTKDEKYACEFINQLKGFVKSWPVEEYLGKVGSKGENTDMSFPGTAWRTIETGIRIYATWLPVMAYFRKSPSWDAEGWICFLNSIHDHAEFLSAHYTNHLRCSNWHTMESTALFQMGVMFPEFKNVNNWRRLGYRRVTHEVRYQFDHFGVHMERTPIYHLTAANTFLQAYRIMKLNGIESPPYMLPILEKTAEYLMKLVKPDFTTPMIGDADRNSLLDRRADTSPYEGMNNTTDHLDMNEMRAFFRVMAEITGREDFLFFSSNGEKGSPPAQKCFSMPDPGFFVFRTGWGSKDSYCLVTGTNLERGESNSHSHDDAAHFELQVEGEDILVDTGRYIYKMSTERDWCEYFHSTAAHNTIQVDGHKMGAVPDTLPNIRPVRTFCHKFETSPEIDLVEVSHNGYAFIDSPVFHLRRVINFKPGVWLIDDVLTGMGNHEYKLYYNFAPGRLTPLKDASCSYRFSVKNVKVNIIPLLDYEIKAEVKEGDTQPKGGWISYGYSLKVPAPQLVYTKKGEAPARFITAIVQDGIAKVEKIHCSSVSYVCLKVISGTKTWDINLGQEKFSIRHA